MKRILATLARLTVANPLLRRRLRMTSAYTWENLVLLAALAVIIGSAAVRAAAWMAIRRTLTTLPTESPELEKLFAGNYFVSTEPGYVEWLAIWSQAWAVAVISWVMLWRAVGEEPLVRRALWLGKMPLQKLRRGVTDGQAMVAWYDLPMLKCLVLLSIAAFCFFMPSRSDLFELMNARYSYMGDDKIFNQAFFNMQQGLLWLGCLALVEIITFALHRAAVRKSLGGRYLLENRHLVGFALIAATTLCTACVIIAVGGRLSEEILPVKNALAVLLILVGMGALGVCWRNMRSITFPKR